MKASHFVKKHSVQFVNASGKQSAPFYFCDNKPHECSQTWQVVRSEFDQMLLDNAREHGVAAHEGVRVLDVIFEGDRAVGVSDSEDDGTTREVRAKVVVDASGQSWTLDEQVQAARLGPGPQQGRHLDLLGRRLPRHRTGRRRHDRLADRRTSKAGSGTSRCTTTSSASASSRRSITSSRTAATTRQIYNEELDTLPRRQGADRKGPSESPATSPRDYSYRGDEGRRRRLGAGRRRLRVSRSALFVGRAAGAQVGRAGGRRHRRRTRERRHLAAQLGKWGPEFNRGIDRMRRLVCEYYDGFSFGSFMRKHPDLRGTVTDLLIGDLFTDQVDDVWEPMEALYPPRKPRFHPGLPGRRRTRRGKGEPAHAAGGQKALK